VVFLLTDLHFGKPIFVSTKTKTIIRSSHGKTLDHHFQAAPQKPPARANTLSAPACNQTAAAPDLYELDTQHGANVRDPDLYPQTGFAGLNTPNNVVAYSESRLRANFAGCSSEQMTGPFPHKPDSISFTRQSRAQIGQMLIHSAETGQVGRDNQRHTRRGAGGFAAGPLQSLRRQ